MAYTALVSLGPAIGVGITSVKLYECGNSCTSCTPITNYTNVAVSSFNPTLLVTGITTGSTCIKAEPIGACSGTTQCIVVSGIPAPTPTPSPSATTPGATPTPTPSSTPGPTATVTIPGATPAPTATATTPAATPTPSATALPGCGSTVTGTYAPSGYTLQTVSLDLSGAINGATISVQYTASNRPNRFNIYGGGSLVVSSLWAGSDTDYQGPWTGNPIDEDGSGYITFVYNSSLSYQLKVDVGGANPSNILEDSWSVTFSCGSPAATPTPTPTSTPSYYDIDLVLSASPSDSNGYFTVYQSSDNITFEESVTLTSTGNDYVTQSFNGTPGYYYYLKVTKPGGTTPDLNLYTQVNNTDFNPGPINGAWCQNNSRLLESDVFQLPSSIQNRASITFFGGIGEGCL